MTPSRRQAGTTHYRRINGSMFLGGFSAFSLLYMAQPLMPQFVLEYGITPAQASYGLSASTAGLALSLIPAALWADRVGRKVFMVLGLLLCTLISIACAFTQDFSQFVVLRFFFGCFLAAWPATALAYLAEEIDPADLGRAVGLYIAGNAMGGMSGRLLGLTLSQWVHWRWSFALLGTVCLILTLLFARTLPQSNHFKIHAQRGGWLKDLKSHMTDPGLLGLFMVAFLLSGSVVSVYNYISFRLGAAPYHLTAVMLCGIYSLYLLGMFGSSRFGSLADRKGRKNVLWWTPVLMLAGLVMTLSGALPFIIIGMGVLTFGFFSGHSVASGWVGARAAGAKALASSLYLTMYYLGASVVGSVAGWAWSGWAWTGVASLTGTALLLCLLVALKLRDLPSARQHLPI
ncbi:MAG: MFS transporter [Burkholderiales bacterium]|nr:MFS transporter [Burkholderiales bacterium]